MCNCMKTCEAVTVGRVSCTSFILIAVTCQKACDKPSGDRYRTCQGESMNVPRYRTARQMSRGFTFPKHLHSCVSGAFQELVVCMFDTGCNKMYLHTEKCKNHPNELKKTFCSGLHCERETIERDFHSKYKYRVGEAEVMMCNCTQRMRCDVSGEEQSNLVIHVTLKHDNETTCAYLST